MSKIKKEIKLHEKIVKDYDKRHHYEFSKYYHHYWNNQIIKMTNADKNACVLDYGCGTGILLEDLVKKYSQVYGIDVSPDMIKRIKINNNNLKSINVTCGENLPFKDNFFNVIFCRGSLHHVENLEKGISEIFRVLKNEGELILSEPNNDSLILRIPRKFYVKHSDHFDHEHHALESKSLIKLLENKKFEFKKLKRFVFFAFPIGGLSDLMPLVKFLIIIDNILSKIFFINRQSWHMIIRVKKNDK